MDYRQMALEAYEGHEFETRGREVKQQWATRDFFYDEMATMRENRYSDGRALR